MATPEPMQFRPERHAPMRELPLWTVLFVAGLVLVVGLREEGGDESARSAARSGAGSGSFSGDLAGSEGVVGSTIPQAPGWRDESPDLVEVSATGNRSERGESLGSPGKGLGTEKEHEGSESGLESGSGGAGDPGQLDGSDAWQRHSRSRPANGAPSEEGSFVQGIRSGEWLIRWPNGELHSAGNYDSGLRDGVWQSFSMNGALIEDVTYLDGALEGSWRSYALGGEVIGEGQHENNHRSGTWTLRYTDGRIKERGNYVDGLREGEWEFFDDLGLPTTRSGHYRAGVKID